MRGCIVFKGRGVVSSWTILGLDGIKVKFHLDETSSIITLLVSTRLGVYVLVISSFHLVGQLLAKAT